MSSSAIGNSQINSAQGPGGNITINTDSFSARDGSQLNAQTEAKANAGDILIQARDSFSLDDSRVASSVEAGAGGQGGDIDIQVTNGSVSLTNGAQLVASTAGKGDAGSVRITAIENLSVNNSSVSSAVEAGAVGNGGDVNINTRSLSLTNGAQLSASTAGQGSPGNISVRDAQSVSLDNHSAISTAVESSAVVPTNAGNAVGNIEIETDTLQLGNGANITASTRGQGNAGSVTVTASKSVSLDNSSATTAVESGGRGNGGDLNINTRSLSLTNDAQISASTAGEGNAGNIKITSDQLSVSDRSQVAVSSTGEGKAGELEVNASDIFLNNQGKLIASTASGEGGNIRLNADNLLLMRRNSLISAEAQNNGNGGNIDINTRFAIAIPSENSDIIANAYRGKGGNIQITAQGVFGLQLRDKLTPFSDITASSQFGLDGVVVINILNVDPSRGLVQLPENLSDPSQQIATGCAVAKGNSFAVTGRGGLSEDPTQTLNGRTVWQDLRVTSSRPGTLAQTPIPQFQPSAKNQQPTPLVEATGWVMNAKGQVELVARAPQVTPNSPWSRPADCQTINPPQ
jgi:large exoprotein involved in heme utilization and adhesion